MTATNMCSNFGSKWCSLLDLTQACFAIPVTKISCQFIMDAQMTLIIHQLLAYSMEMPT